MDEDVAYPLELRFSSPVLPCYKFSHSRSNRSSVIMEICQKILTLMPRLSRSLKVIGTDTDRSATYDFLLVFHSNYGPISYTVFEIKGNICKIFPPPYI